MSFPQILKVLGNPTGGHRAINGENSLNILTIIYGQKVAKRFQSQFVDYIAVSGVTTGPVS